MSSNCTMEHHKLFDQQHCFLVWPKLWVQALLKVPSNVQQSFFNHCGRFLRKRLVIFNPYIIYHNIAVLNFWIHFLSHSVVKFYAMSVTTLPPTLLLRLCFIIYNKGMCIFKILYKRTISHINVISMQALTKYMSFSTF